LKDETADRPLITIKYAQTLDGRIATSTGDSQWISGPDSRAVAHRLRAEHDAIMVGVGTILSDDPLLTVRLAQGTDPLRVVVDSALRTPLTARVLTSDTAHTVLATTDAAPPQRVTAVCGLGARVYRLPKREGRVDLPALLHALAAEGIQSVLVEGGAGLVTELLRLRCADRVAIFIAPKLTGAGIEAVGDLGTRTIGDALTFAEPSVDTIGQDILFRGYIQWPGREHRSA